MDCGRFFQMRLPDDLQQGPEGKAYYNAVLEVAQLPYWSYSAAETIAKKIPEHMRLTFLREAEGHYLSWCTHRAVHN